MPARAPKDPARRITIEEALAHPWFTKNVGAEGLHGEGGSNVREVMKEFNAKRAVLKLTNLRQRGRANSITEESGVGPIAALKNFIGRRPSAADSDAAAAVAAVAAGGSPTAKGKFARRRGSNTNSDLIQEAAASHT